MIGLLGKLLCDICFVYIAGLGCFWGIFNRAKPGVSGFGGRRFGIGDFRCLG